MADFEIRPTMRFIVLGYLITGLLLAAAVIWWWMERGTGQERVALGLVVATGILQFWPIDRHVRRQRICLRISNGQLQFSNGFLTTTTKTLQIANVQDVTVRRSVSQRLWGLGDIRIETAGQSSGVQVDNVNAPQDVADRILAIARENKGSI